MSRCKKNYKYIFCCGMYRSASTWQYLVTSDLIEKKGLGRRGGFVTINEFLNEEPVDDEIVVYKTHDYHPVYEDLIKQEKAKAIYVYRDIRDVLCSLMWKFQISFEEALYGHDAFRMAIKGYYQWASCSEVLIQNYDAIISSPLDNVKSITKHLGIVADDELLISIFEDHSKHANQKKTQKIKKKLNAQGKNLELPENALLHNKNSLLHWNHIRPTENNWNEILSNEQIEEMRPFVTQWLLDAGYENDANWRKIEFANRRLAKVFISHSLNFEDVMLWRALKHVDNGCYIDIGVGNLTQASITKAFYDIGWCGINAEPTQLWFEKLKEHRPRDINLNIALGENEKKAKLYEVLGIGFSTLHKDIAQNIAEPNGYKIISYIVPVTTLDAIFEKHQRAEIHFLKLGPQDTEKNMLDGASFKVHRPWIILVSVKFSNGSVSSVLDWEPQLLKKGYHFVYFDGIHRFYVVNEREYLDQYFMAPPNYWDSFEHKKVQEMRLLIGKQQEQLMQRKQDKDAIQQLLGEEQLKKKSLENKLNEERLQKEHIARKFEKNVYIKEGLEKKLIDENKQKSILIKRIKSEIEQTRVYKKHNVILASELQLIYNTRSWKVVMPLRKIYAAIKKWA